MITDHMSVLVYKPVVGVLVPLVKAVVIVVPEAFLWTMYQFQAATTYSHVGNILVAVVLVSGVLIKNGICNSLK